MVDIDRLEQALSNMNESMEASTMDESDNTLRQQARDAQIEARLKILVDQMLTAAVADAIRLLKFDKKRVLTPVTTSDLPSEAYLYKISADIEEAEARISEKQAVTDRLKEETRSILSDLARVTLKL